MAEEKEEKKNGKDGDKAQKELPEELLVQTQHLVTLNGEEIAYTATAGTLLVRDEKEEARAEVFYISYTRNGMENLADRPVTFSFNGGPGSSSVWLHLGVLGPRRVLLDEDGGPLPPPYRLVDNDFSLLDATDLVFIDPVSTGFSRPLPDEKADQFHNFDKDIESVGEFIRLYSTRNGRWTSPKFLIGESYGTTRAAGLSGHLQKRFGLYLNGIMLVSSILDFMTARFTAGNDLPYMLFLPTYAATAWYHQRLPGDLQADLRRTLDEVESFVMNEYALALLKGDDLPPDEEEEIAARLARYTGLTTEYVRRTNLRINIHRFAKELLRDQRRTVGRLDSRFTGIDRDAAGERYDSDPSMNIITGPYTATLNDYVRQELGFERDVPYEILTPKVHPWKFEKHMNEFLNVAETLRAAMSKNPFLKVFVANGYYDLATPYFATEYTFSHLQLDPALRDNISMGFYEAGHMMYIHLPSLAQLKQDLADFIARSTP
jgi:carboxypeptidase C (cathepsin A)